jgi:hypothetical protein
MALNPATRDKLKTVSTATLCTALFKRGLRNQFIQDVRPVNPNLPNMVGEAFTLRYIPAREDLNPITVFQDPKHPQRVAVEQCPEGAVMVIDSRKDARAASAGSILISRLMVRGAAGIVTDGGFPRLARSGGHAFPHLPPASLGADQPHAAPGDRHQCADRLRRCGGVSRRCDRGRQGRCVRDPGAPGRRDRRRGGGDDRLRGFRHRGSAEGPAHRRPLSADAAAVQGRLRHLAQGQGR